MVQEGRWEIGYAARISRARRVGLVVRGLERVVLRVLRRILWSVQVWVSLRVRVMRVGWFRVLVGC